MSPLEGIKCNDFFVDIFFCSSLEHYNFFPFNQQNGGFPHLNTLLSNAMKPKKIIFLSRRVWFSLSIETLGQTIMEAGQLAETFYSHHDG